MKEYTLKAKEAAVTEVQEQFAEAESVILVDYRGLSVLEDTELRNQFRAAGVTYKVIKNSIIKRAADKLEIEGLDPMLEGPTSVAYSKEDPAAPAKVLSKFIKDVNKMSIKGGVLDGKMIDAAMVDNLAKMPSKEELLAKMMGSLNAPVTGLVMALSGVLGKFVRVVNAIKEQKDA
ncbi:MAG: 50S ribosomal protein L10 [Christensenellaceae bacterium]